jgi:hypothetical protein
MTNDATLALAGATVPPPLPTPSFLPAASAEGNENLHDLLGQAATIASLLSQTFGGDSSFDEPNKAPGLSGMVQAAAFLLSTAGDLSKSLAVSETTRDVVCHASSLAAHLEAVSQDDLGRGLRGFRLGDRCLSMCYWTVEKLAARAIEELTKREVQA